MFHLVTGLVGLFVVVRFILPLPWPRPAKLIASAVLLVISVHHLLSRLAFGTMFSPEVPGEVMILVNWLFGTMLLLALFQFLLEIVTGLGALLRRRRVRAPLWARYTIGAIALVVAAFGVSQAIRVPPVKHVEIAIRGLPAEFDGFHLVHLTDLHISRIFEAPWVESVVRDTNALSPDLVVITGDLIDGSIEARRHDVEPLKKLRAENGVYAIPGNHEYYFGYPEWMRRYEELGLRTLANNHVVLRRGDKNLVLAGVTDIAAAGRNFPEPDVRKAIDGAPANAPVILLDHQPKNAAVGARAGAALQLSGHTHGGMILGFDRLIASFNNDYVSGLYTVDGMTLYVSNGTALWIGFALRLGKPSELTSIVLRAA
jgi:predicted MPP superfamily phosphohydrolase